MDASDPQVQAAFEAEINAGAGPDEPIDLSGDGGVMKTILKEGSGWERPNKGIEVGGTCLHLFVLPFLPLIAFLGLWLAFSLLPPIPPFLPVLTHVVSLENGQCTTLAP